MIVIIRNLIENLNLLAKENMLTLSQENINTSILKSKAEQLGGMWKMKKFILKSNGARKNIRYAPIVRAYINGVKKDGFL